MKLLDIVILLVLILPLIRGYRRGFLKELGALAVLLFLPWALTRFNLFFFGLWGKLLSNFIFAQLLSLASIVLLLLWGGNLLGGILERILPRFILPFNSLLGAVIAIAKTLLWLSSLLAIAGSITPLAKSSLWQESALLEPLASLGELVLLTIGNILAQPQPQFLEPGELI